jgi:two-component system, OmpR family, phosphate regulon sensor histidine kinase PhoR
MCLADHVPVTINYQHFLQKLLDAAPWPVIIIDRSVCICFYNLLAAQLFDATSPLLHVKLDAVIADAAIMQLVQESVYSGRVRRVSVHRVLLVGP